MDPDYTPEESLFLAIERDDIQAVERLLATDPGLVRARNRFEDTPLHVVGSGAAPAIALALIRAGVDLHAQNFRGFTPLHEAASLGKTPIVQVLLDSGASTEMRDHAGLTPLDHARSLGPNHPIVQLLCGDHMHTVPNKGQKKPAGEHGYRPGRKTARRRDRK